VLPSALRGGQSPKALAFNRARVPRLHCSLRSVVRVGHPWVGAACCGRQAGVARCWCDAVYHHAGACSCASGKAAMQPRQCRLRREKALCGLDMTWVSRPRMSRRWRLSTLWTRQCRVCRDDNVESRVSWVSCATVQRTAKGCSRAPPANSDRRPRGRPVSSQPSRTSVWGHQLCARGAPARSVVTLQCAHKGQSTLQSKFGNGAWTCFRSLECAWDFLERVWVLGTSLG
jgi:hypothetical protein